MFPFGMRYHLQYSGAKLVCPGKCSSEILCIPWKKFKVPLAFFPPQGAVYAMRMLTSESKYSPMSSGVGGGRAHIIWSCLQMFEDSIKGGDVQSIGL